MDRAWPKSRELPDCHRWRRSLTPFLGPDRTILDLKSPDVSGVPASRLAALPSPSHTRWRSCVIPPEVFTRQFVISIRSFGTPNSQFAMASGNCLDATKGPEEELSCR